MCDAPILLVNSNRKTIKLIQAYIKTNLKEDGMIYILGGTGAVPEAAEAGLGNYEIKRLAGSDRYTTNLEILKEAALYNEDNEIIICTGTGFADSLSAAALGKPILLVGKRLNDDQKVYLASIGEDNAYYIIGGTGAVSVGIESEINAYGHTERVWGNTRYDTSVEVARVFFPESEYGVLAYAKDFPDGLCAGALAYELKGPLILTANGNTKAAETYAEEAGLEAGYVLGGISLIDDESVSAIFNIDPDDILIK